MRLTTRLNGVLALLPLCLALAGCSTDFPEDPTEEPPTIITEPPFTGTIEVNGAVTQPFLTTSSGKVDVTIMSLSDSNGPAAIGVDGPLRIGLMLGLWNGTVCGVSVPTLFNDNAFVSTVITGQATGPGALCVRVSDVGKLTEPVTFEIEIKHP